MMYIRFGLGHNFICSAISPEAIYSACSATPIRLTLWAS